MSQMSHQVAKCDMTPTACNRGSRVMFCIAHHLQVVRRCFQVPVKNKINLKLCTETWEPRTWFADKLWQCSRWIGWVMLCMEEAGTGENTPWLSSASSWISNSREISFPICTENHPYTSQKWGQMTSLYLPTGLSEAYENDCTILYLFLTSFCVIKCAYSFILPWHLYLIFFSGNNSSLFGSFYDTEKVKEI